jgi:hypothetical protein
MLLVAVGVVCAVGSAEAKKAKKTAKKTAPAPRLFADLDVNADTQVSKEEFVTAKLEKGIELQTKIFTELDTDLDGFLTETEYEAINEPTAPVKKGKKGKKGKK